MSKKDKVPEYFEVFDNHGHLCGLLPRQDVHRRGLWHRSADVWVYRPDGSLLLQCRSRNKDLFPGCWDYSMGEHLLPSESYLAGARRGLREELGIVARDVEFIGDLRHVCNHCPERDIHDRELSRSFRAVHDGKLYPDPGEVAEVRWMCPDQVVAWMLREPSAFTPWFIQAARELDLLPAVDCHSG